MDNSRGPSLSTHRILHVLRHIFLGRLCLHCFESVPVALDLLTPPPFKMMNICGPTSQDRSLKETTSAEMTNLSAVLSPKSQPVQIKC